MNYWFIIGDKCFKYGTGKKYKIIYCKTVDLSEIYMWQLIEGKSLRAVIIFEDLFKSNGFFTFGVDEYTIHVNKRNNIIALSIINHIAEDSVNLWDFLKDQPINWRNLLNAPMILSYEKYIIGFMILCAMGFLIFMNNDYALAHSKKEEKLMLIQEILKK